jgi:hypothetical protein
MQKYRSIVRKFFNFCKSVGHDEKDCCAFDLMRECISYAYRVQGEESEGGGLQYNTPRGFCYRAIYTCPNLKTSKVDWRNKHDILSLSPQ